MSEQMSQNRRFDAVVFDLDGTLLYTLEDIAAALNHALAQHGLQTYSVDAVRGFLGRGFKRLVSCAVPSLPVGSQAYRQLLSDFAGYYTDHCQDRTVPYPGVVSLLEHLEAAGVRTAIASNKGDAAVKKLASYHFSGLIGPDHAFGERPRLERKPAPDIVCAALDALRTPPDRALYVGDSDVDFAVAENIPMSCCLVSWGFKDRSFLESLRGKDGVRAPRVVDDALSLEQVCLG